MTATYRAGQVLALIGALLVPQLLPQLAHGASTMACMTAHKDEMRTLNNEIAELEKMKITPGGPHGKQGECAHRLQTIRGSVPPLATDKNTGDHMEKIACLYVKKTLLEQQCVCEGKGIEFSADPAMIDKTLAAQKRFSDAQKAARKGALRNSPEVRKIADDTSRLNGCYGPQVIEILNKSTAAVEKIGRAAK